MKILLIHPQAEVHRAETGIYGKALRYAPLTMATLATLVPPDLSAETRVVDEMVERVDGNWPADLVGLTGISGTVGRAYELADRFRKRGVTVVLGGVHASLLPDEAARHADAVVIGYAEETWPALLRDFAAGRLEPRYRMATVPRAYARPDRRQIRRSAYLQPNTVELVRGCGNKCEFCSSRSLYPTPIPRDPDEVLDEIVRLPGKMISFLDPNLLTDLPLAYRFFARLGALRKWWVGCATVEIREHPDLLDLMVASGCKGLLVGFESVNQASLDSLDKPFNCVADFRETVRILHARGLIVEGCFVLGFDADDASIFQRTADFVTGAGIDYVHYTIYTPFPGTPAFIRLEAEGRIETRDWSRYNGRHAVFRPRHLTSVELESGVRRLWVETYRLPTILRRLSQTPALAKPVVLMSNLHSKRFQRKASALNR